MRTDNDLVGVIHVDNEFVSCQKLKLFDIKCKPEGLF